ncbi:MAG TPA: methyl-accepting chemotaxis protein [Pilimelia sp.]|nr:methyl-accepting chemotaxis protein [Pilimelia sp.]
MSVRAWSSRAKRRFVTRLVVSVLALTLPIMAVIVVGLTASAVQELERNALRVLQNEAGLVASQVQSYIGERRTDLRLIAQAVGSDVAQAEARLAALHRIDPGFVALEMVDVTGRRLAVSAEDGHPQFRHGTAEWFRRAAGGSEAISPLTRSGDDLELMVAQPIRDADGRVAAVLIGDLDVALLWRPLDQVDYARTGEIYLATPDKRMILSSRAGAVSDDDDVIRAGALSTPTDTAAVRAALTGANGATEALDYRGVRSMSGYASVPTTGWAVVAKEDREEALTSARRQWNAGLTMILVATLLLALGAMWFARRESSRMRAVVGGIRTVGASVTNGAQDVSSASRELATTTTEQSASVTQTSATMEELARTAGAISDTMDRVAAELEDTRVTLKRAQDAIAASGERTLALSARVHEISGILELINEIADQTNLLALNAAIEAARAGESGRGFAVVADEVRRLAERSKTSAAEISSIVSAAESENTSTVLAMEAGAKQVDRSLDLIDGVLVGGEQVRLTTQQQRAATEQVVSAMAQMTEGSRQLSATAQQLAGSAAAMAELATDLENTARSAADRL